MNIKSLKTKIIGVLMGGASSEREISLQTGRAVSGALKEAGFKVRDIDVGDRIAEDLRRGKIDIAFIALHGPLGEDGTIQGLLEVIRIPYTGSGVLSSALAMDKIKSKEIFVQYNIPTPSWQVRERGDSSPVRGFPAVVKPSRQGSAVGITIVDSARNIPSALRLAWRFDRRIIIEKFISGMELTVGILNNKPLPVIQIIPRNRFYDFESKYAAGGSRHVIPAPLPLKIQKQAQELALAAHRALGCSGATRVDLILDRANKLFVLEVNTIPGMTATSLLPDAARAAGLDFTELVGKILRGAGLNKN